jgi:transposase-like protein
MRNLLQRVSKHAHAMAAALVRTIFAQPDHDTAQRQLEQVCAMLQRRFPQAVALLQAAADEVLTSMRFPSAHWRQIHPTHPLERLNRELARRCDVVGIFPHAAAVLRLVGALLEEVQDEWLVARRYSSQESMRKLLPSPVEETMLGVPETV